MFSLRRLFGDKRPYQIVPDRGVNHLLAFAPESRSRNEAVPVAVPRKLEPAPRRLGIASMAATFVLAVLVSALAVVMIRRLAPLPANALGTGKLTINTRPEGAEVLIDGQPKGATPLSLALPPGAHTMTVRGGGEDRVVPLTIAAGAEVSHSFEMRVDASPDMGQVSIVTDPPGARVTVDQHAFGSAPVTVGNLTPGEHRIRVTGETGVVDRIVKVTAGGAASVRLSLPRRDGAPPGSLSIVSPFPLVVQERGEVIGTSEEGHITVASGRHDIVLANRGVGYEDRRTVDVGAGQVVALRIEPPTASVSINARPWADIFLDGRHVGQTPIGNLMVPVGTHELVFRHPKLGERKQTAIIGTSKPNRFTADFSQ